MTLTPEAGSSRVLTGIVACSAGSDLEGFAVEFQKNFRDLSTDTGVVAVSESAKRQIAQVLVSQSGAGTSPTFMEGFNEEIPRGPLMGQV